MPRATAQPDPWLRSQIWPQLDRWRLGSFRRRSGEPSGNGLGGEPKRESSGEVFVLYYEGMWAVWDFWVVCADLAPPHSKEIPFADYLHAQCIVSGWPTKGAVNIVDIVGVGGLLKAL